MDMISSTDITQTPKTLSTSDMALLLTSDNSQDQTQTVVDGNVNNSNGSHPQEENVMNSQNQVPQTLLSSGAQMTPISISSVQAQSLLNNASSKRVILQPANASMNALVQNLVQNPSLIQGVKRAAPGSQVVTKFIIQKNATGNPQPVLVSHPKPVSIATTGANFSIVSSSALTSLSPAVSTLGNMTSGQNVEIVNSEGNNGKIPISPAKAQTRIRVVPVPGVNQQQPTASPQKIITAVPANALLSTSTGQTITLSAAGNQATSDSRTFTISPSKKIIMQNAVPVYTKPTVQQLLDTAQQQKLVQTQPKTVTLPISQGSGLSSITVNNQVLQPIQVSGSKFNYVRLVSPTTSAPTQGIPISLVQSIAKPIVPAASMSGTGTAVTTTTASGGNILTVQQPQKQEVKITLPINQTLGNQMTVNKPLSQIQRVILPAQQSLIRPDLPSIPPAQRPRPVVTNVSQASTVQLPDGASLLRTQNEPQQQLGSGITLLPAQYMNSLAQLPQQSNKPIRPKTETYERVPLNPVTVANSLEMPDIDLSPHLVESNGITEAPGTRPRKPCNCTKSQCLKLYCDCFANGEFCNGCNCVNCYNNIDHEDERSKAIRSCLDRNPTAFHPKIGKSGVIGDVDRRHTKGCNCKKSGCLKNYCECYEAKINCSDMCRCVGCKNFDESEERQSLMSDAPPELTSRVPHYPAVKKTPRVNNIHDPNKPNSRLPYTFVTSEVGEATCACLLAQAEDSERERHSPAMEERLILQEFGRCLLQIIESANRTKTIHDVLGSTL